MENLNIKMFQDGNDLYICFKDCSPDTREFLKNLLKPCVEGDSLLYEAEKDTEAIMIPEEYKNSKLGGMSLEEALNTYGDTAFANIVFMKNKGCFKDKVAEVNDILNEYLFNTFSCVDPAEYSGNMDEEAADKWIKCYSSLITPEMEIKIKNATGFASFEDFKKEATLEQKSSLIYSVIKNLGFNTHN